MQAGLDAHRRVLAHLRETGAATLVTEVVKASEHARSADAPTAELQEIQVLRHSIKRILARSALPRQGYAPRPIRARPSPCRSRPRGGFAGRTVAATLPVARAFEASFANRLFDGVVFPPTCKDVTGAD